MAENKGDDVTLNNAVSKFIEKLNQVDETNLGFNYIMRESDDENNVEGQTPFRTKSLSVDRNTKRLIRNSILGRLTSMDSTQGKATLMEVIEFDYTRELAEGQVGLLRKEGFPLDLASMLKSIGDSRQAITTRDARLQDFVCYVLSYGNLKIFKKIPRTTLLTSGRKPHIGLTANKVRGISEQYILQSPYDFDVICDGNVALIFNERSFFFLFGETKVLESKIDDMKKSIDTVIAGTDTLLAYVKKGPQTLRSFYYRMASGALRAIDQATVDRVNQRAKKKFTLDHDGKVICKDENARDVYNLFMDKIGENLVTEAPILILSSSNNV